MFSCSIFTYSLERSSYLVQFSSLHDLSTLFSALRMVLTLWDVSRRWFILTMDFSVQCINAGADNRYWLMQILPSRYVSAHVHCWYLSHHASWECRCMAVETLFSARKGTSLCHTVTVTFPTLVTRSCLAKLSGHVQLPMQTVPQCLSVI